MSFITEYAEVEETRSGQFRHTQHLKKVAYRENGTLREIVRSWKDSGISARPHTIDQAPIMVSVGEGGMRRMHPTRELDRYIEIGAPYVKVGGVWQQVNLGSPVRQGHRLMWTRPQANMYVDFGGHFVKMAIWLKNGFMPEDNQIAFPVGMSGFTRNGFQLLREGVPIARFQQPYMIDFDDSTKFDPIPSSIVHLGGQAYWLLDLPNVLGYSKPVIDPTLDLQPDATAGKDAWVNYSTPNNNWGTHVSLLMGEDSGNSPRTSFLSFDLSSIPSGAIVSSADLELYCDAVQNSSQVLVAYRALVAWDEGASNGTAGDVSWNERKSGVAWGTAGGRGSGVDRESTSNWSILASGISVPETVVTNVKTDVEAWVAGTPNYGWILDFTYTGGVNNQVSFASSDSGTATRRPRLVIEYTLAGRRMIIGQGVGRGVLRGAR